VYDDDASGAGYVPTPPADAPSTPGQPPPTSGQGVGPWPGGRAAWPAGEWWDPELLELGDARNVVDRYRYWRMDAIVADIDRTRHPLHVAIENFTHDSNIGSVVRTANAFAVAEVHIVGRRRWNRRGAMVTDRYQHLRHHDTVAGFLGWAREAGLPVLGIDNIPGSVPLEGAALPGRAVMVFGQESAGLSAEMVAGCERVLHVTQYGSTRSMNVGAAAAIAMWAWVVQHSEGAVPRCS
jgi:tRNA G18 (ribose-2'-O)-methylase SpoU